MLRNVMTALLLVMAFAGPAAAQQRPAPPAPATPLGEQPRNQRQLLAIVDDFAQRYTSAPNEMAAGGQRPVRKAAICAMAGDQVRAWVGTVEQLTAASNGDGALRVRLDARTQLATRTGSFGDTETRTLIPAGSPLFATASGLRRGQRIAFEGRFFQDRDDCLEEVSLTVRGGMTAPIFLFRFTAIRPLD